MTLSLPSAILFDWDNTLVDSENACFQAINKVFQAFNKPLLSEKDFDAQPALSVRVYFEKIFPPHQKQEAEALFEEYITTLPFAPFSKSQALLEWITRQGIPMAVVSNKSGDPLRRDIHRLRWENHFYTAVGSYDTAEDKPSPTPLKHALSLGSIHPGKDVWFVGDSVVDMMCAHQAGCFPVALRGTALDSPLAGLRAKGEEGLHMVLQGLCAPLEKQD